MLNCRHKYRLNSKKIYNYDVPYGGIFDFVFDSYNNKHISEETLLDNIVVINLDVLSFFPLNPNVVPVIGDIETRKLSGFFCYYYPERLQLEVWQFYNGEKHGFHKIYNIDIKPGVCRNANWEQMYPYLELFEKLLDINEVFSEEYYKNELSSNSAILQKSIENAEINRLKIIQFLETNHYRKCSDTFYNSSNYHENETNKELLPNIDIMPRFFGKYLSEISEYDGLPLVYVTGYACREKTEENRGMVYYTYTDHYYYKRAKLLAHWITNSATSFW